MSDEQHIGNDKSRYLNAPKRTEVGHRSGLAGLKTAPRIKSYSLFIRAEDLKRNM